MDGEERRLLSVSSRRKVLEALIKSGEATAYEIAKKINIPDSAVGKHLRILREAGLVEGPEIDISGGRLKKTYKPSPHAEKTLKDFWLKEIQSAPESIQKILSRKHVEEDGGE